MEKLKFFKEEETTNREELAKAEKVWKTRLPKEYKAFLLQHNGAIVYPDYPTIPVDNDLELDCIDRFLSVGDVILQKQYFMSYSLRDETDNDDLKASRLRPENLLTFAIGARGFYFINLAWLDFGRLYYCNFSGGDGIVRLKTKSFSKFLSSLHLPPWAENDLDPNYQLNDKFYSRHKVFQTYLFHTPNNPQLGLERFKAVFKIHGDIQPPERGYPNIPQKYVDDRVKLDYLLEQGCRTDGLLRYAKKAETIRYLVHERGLDINQTYKGRYPLQTYLTPTSDNETKVKYLLLDQLLEMGIELDWAVQVEDAPESSMLEKLAKLHDKYLKYELYEKQRWERSRSRKAFTPFKRSKRIEEQLGI